VCNVKIQGASAVADKLAGGIDGVYEVKGCWNGRPKYKRQNSPKDRACEGLRFEELRDSGRRCCGEEAAGS